MADKKPWTKWYFRDWKGDKALRACSLTARGLWLEMLAIMDEAEPYGHLVINGEPLDAEEIANQAGGGATAADVEIMLAKMKKAGVFGVTPEGVIFSKRMVRDKAKADEDAKNGKKGGNPYLKAKTNPPVNPTYKSEDKPSHEPVVNQLPQPDDNGGDKAQKPEARDQKAEKKEPPSGAANPSKRPKVPKSKLSPDWMPSAEDLSYARSKGLTDAEASAECTRFVRYWTSDDAAKGGLKADWPATWRNWIDRCADEVIRRRARVFASPPVSITVPQDDLEQWLMRIDGLVTRGVWPAMWGPKPGEEFCQVLPAAIALRNQALKLWRDRGCVPLKAEAAA